LKDPGSPSHIGRYEIRKELGRGTMGVVYEAHDPALGRTVALKTIQVPLAASAAEREEYERRFLAEARIAARLSHSGIVVVHDVSRDAEHDILYIALEHLHGRTLAEVAAEGALDWREALRIVARVAEALHYAHTQGVVHRDIKPANIMVLASGEPKIMDFGIAKLEAVQLTSTGQFFGTPLFMSPEQALGQPVDARTDLFSLGSVAYLLLTGHPPFEADSVPGILARVTYQQPRPMSEAAPAVPADVAYVVTRAMAKDPAARYGDGRTMADDIEDVLAGREPRHRKGWTAPAMGTGTVASAGAAELPELRLEAQEARRPARRRRPLMRLVLLLAAVAGVYFYLHPADRRFWRAAFAEARQSALVQEVRAGRLWTFVVDQPTPAPAPVVMPTTTAASAAPAAPGETPIAPSATPSPAPEPPPAVSAGPTEDIPTPAAPAAAPAPAPAPENAPTSPPDVPATAPGRLAIEFEHHLRHGTIEVWVDGASVLDEDFDGRVTRKILTLTLHKGLVQQQLTLAPGRHEVRVQVSWDDNVKAGRIAGTFRPGTTRRLEVQVGRLRGNLSLAWK
jgi:predicted Ser/Thr protein kinase